MKIAIGPDGYPYLRAFRAADPQIPNTAPYRMPDLANRAIAEHGIAVYDRSPTESKPSNPADLSPTVTSILPLEVRRVLAAFMKTGGIAKPTVVAVLFVPPSGVPNRSNYTTESDWVAELNWIRPPDDDRVFTPIGPSAPR